MAVYINATTYDARATAAHATSMAVYTSANATDGSEIMGVKNVKQVSSIVYDAETPQITKAGVDFGIG